MLKFDISTIKYNIMKIIKAIPPYLYTGASNFKYYPFEAWASTWGKDGERFLSSTVAS